MAGCLFTTDLNMNGYYSIIVFHKLPLYVHACIFYDERNVFKDL